MKTRLGQQKVIIKDSANKANHNKSSLKLKKTPKSIWKKNEEFKDTGVRVISDQRKGQKVKKPKANIFRSN